jgi:hypothetical protein
MPRYVILDHDHPFRHWDFMLEWGDRLRTWRVLSEPVAGRAIFAEALGDHRLAYLDYEGTVGGGRGRIVRWDAGTYRLQSESADELRLTLSGGRLAGQVSLTWLAGSWRWRLEQA